MRSPHPLFIVSISAIIASVAVATKPNNGIQISTESMYISRSILTNPRPHRLFRDGRFRKTDDSDFDALEVVVPTAVISNDATISGSEEIRTFKGGTRNYAIIVDSNVDEAPTDEDLDGWYNYTRQQSGGGSLSMVYTTDLEFDPDCVEFEVDVTGDSNYRRHSLLRRSLEYATKSSKEHKQHTHPNMHHPHPNHLAKSSKLGKTETYIEYVDYEEYMDRLQGNKIVQGPESESDSSSTSTNEVSVLSKSSKLGKVSKSSKSKSGKSKSGKVVKCTNPPVPMPPSKPPSSEIMTNAPVSSICFN